MLNTSPLRNNYGLEEKIKKETKSQPKTALLLLAAGKSTRTIAFNKLSKELNGVPLLTHCYNAIKYSKIEQFIIVASTENYHQAIKLGPPFPEVSLLESTSEGLGYSISHGMSHLNKDISSVIVCLSDTPLISKFHVNLLINSNKMSNYRGIHRIYDVNDTPGHPVLFNEGFFLELSKLRSDKDPKILVNKNRGLITKIKVKNLSPTTDLDTEKDWLTFKSIRIKQD